jgi:hypothetical protein
MGGQAQQQPVFYDADMGQYYTQEFQSPSYGMYNNPMFNGMGYMQQSPMSAMFGKGGERTYLNNFGQSSPAMQPQAPYEYADVSLASLFPMLQGQSQGGGDSALAGLLSGSAPSATGQASSGAGRFL